MKKFDFIPDVYVYFQNGECELLSVQDMTIQEFLEEFNGEFPPRADVQRFEPISDEESRLAHILYGHVVDATHPVIDLSDRTGHWENINGGHTLEIIKKNLPILTSELSSTIITVRKYHCKTRAAEEGIANYSNAGKPWSAQDVHVAAMASSPESNDLTDLAKKIFEGNITEEYQKLYSVMGITKSATRASITKALENIASRMMESINPEWKFGKSSSGQIKNAEAMYKHTTAAQRKAALLLFAEIVSNTSEVAPWLMSKSPIECVLDSKSGKRGRASLIAKCGYSIGAALSKNKYKKILDNITRLDDCKKLYLAKMLDEILNKLHDVDGCFIHTCRAIENGNSQSKALYEAQKKAFGDFFTKASKELEASCND